MRTDHIEGFNATLVAARVETDAMIAHHEAELQRLRLFRQVLGQMAAQEGPHARPAEDGAMPGFLSDAPAHAPDDDGQRDAAE